MNYKQLLILFTVFLMCSITPATAIQNNQEVNSDADGWGGFNETYSEDMTKLLNSFDEASNTELKPEQDQYLSEHEPILLTKAETILYNLQQFLNILLAEYNLENRTTLKSGKNDGGGGIQL